ncbi:MAG: thiamine pyrophosphate-dependent enzyme [Nitrososphaeria archaeon]|nr:thiamine pyrophosphate-dependent enzyme [Nitrososphaeria archaeon]
MSAPAPAFKTIKDLPREEWFASGHRLCAGCGPGIAARLMLKAIRGPTIIVNPTGCIEVSTTCYPYTAWRVPYVHIAFDNAAAVASGIVEAINVLHRKRGKKLHDVIAFAGDGGTFDIGFQALSGALERGHNMLYICYDNEAYMNTGIQRSGATPLGAATTTSPAGKVIPGKQQKKKDLIGIAVAHGIPYAATSSISHPLDFVNKVRKALEIDGPKVIHVLAPCVPGWGYPTSETVRLARLAVETRYFPIYEVEYGKVKINIRVDTPKPLEEFLKTQRRFAHLFRPENARILEALKKAVEENWERLVKLEESGVTL